MDIQFVPLRVDDLPQVAAWLREPHVAVWWSAQLDEEAMRAKYLPRIEGLVPVSVFIIRLNGEPVGFIQMDYSEAMGAPESCSIDLVIGLSSLTGKGLGPAVIKAFVRDHVFRKTTASRCSADPLLANTHSVRAFEKAGFVRVRTFYERGKEHLLLERQRLDSES